MTVKTAAEITSYPMNGFQKENNMDPVELMCLYWTTAGIFPGQAGISRFDFRERVEAAARAGFKGIGI